MLKKSVEGASVYSKQARSRNDVGRATVIGFGQVAVHGLSELVISVRSVHLIARLI